MARRELQSLEQLTDRAACKLYQLVAAYAADLRLQLEPLLLQAVFQVCTRQLPEAFNAMSEERRHALRERIQVEVGDALALSYEAGAFDVTHAAMFMHHFRPDVAAVLLREMNRTSGHGLVVNDLHRHPLGYYGIWALAHAFPVSPMFRHDAPLSVLRGFRRDELYNLAVAADLPTPDVRWHWAFRWTLSTVG